jgi:hypothetical protein
MICFRFARRWAAVLGGGLVFSMTVMAAAPAAPATESAPVFADFTTPDGAMTVFAKGDYVEPYAAIEALLVAHRLGVDVRANAAALADWLLPYQQANGPFPRICRSGGDSWVACGLADADDSLAVFWCLLVNEVLQGPVRLQASCGKSLENLATLWDPRRETFQALTGRTEAYFADNVEVIGALRYLRADPRTAARYARELGALPSHTQMLNGLTRSFNYRFDGALEPEYASLPPTPPGFYPNAVTPVYLWVFDLDTGPVALRKWAVWKHRYERAWLAGKADPFPWGLIAWAAYQLGDRKVAAAWLQAAAQWRSEGRWNLMEEGAWIGLSHAMAISQ